MENLNKTVYNKLIEVFSNNYMPKWLVFVLDIMLITASFFISTFIWQSYTIDFHVNPTFQYLAALYIGIYIIGTLIFQTFSGIIRYSSTNDFIRLLLMNIFVGVAIFLLDIKFQLVEHNFKYSKGILVYWISFTFLFLFIFRKSVRTIYNLWNTHRVFKTRVMVVICDDKNIGMMNVFTDNRNSTYVPVAYIDLTEKLQGKRIGNIPINKYCNNILDLSQKYNSTTLFILKKDIPQILDLTDDCLNNGIEMIASEVNLFNGKIDLSQNVQRIQIEDLLNREVITRDKEPQKDLLNNKCILVTGGAGSIGSEIVRQLCEYSCKIVVVDSAETPLHNISLEIADRFPDSTLIPIISDVRNVLSLERIFSIYKPDIVFHAAAYKHVPLMESFPEEAVLANVLGSKNIADLCYRYGVKKMVMISTDKAVNPTNIMGASKRIAEQYISALYQKNSEQDHSVKMVTTRFGNVLGSNGSVVPLFKRQIAKGGPVTITHRDIIRYFMTIPEACGLVLEAASMGNGGEIFVFDMGKPVKIYDLALKMIRLSGLKPFHDIDVIETGLRPGEKLYEELLTEGENNLPTYNSKIMIAKVETSPFDELNEKVENLIKEARLGNRIEVVKIMKNIVPEFISNNSCYECLDKHIVVKNTNTQESKEL